MQVSRLADAELIPDIRLKRLNIVIFRTTEGKIETYTSINFDWCRIPFLGIEFFTFNEKKIETYTSIFQNLTVKLHSTTTTSSILQLHQLTDTRARY